MSSAKQFSYYAVIYNPNSTGDAPGVAKKVLNSLSRATDESKVDLLPTQHAGHAREIAKKVAAKYSRPLIISVSGDGGYHEVINGVIDAKDSGVAKNPVVTVVGAGNANDHYRVVHKQRTITERLKRDPRTIDLIKVVIKQRSGEKRVFYAHSYVGIGLTPRVAEELNRHKLNIFKEAKIILTALFSIRPTKIESGGQTKQVDSLVFANISQMAKVLTLTDDNSLHDGKFELVEIPHTNIIGLLKTLVQAATVGLKKQPKHAEYKFTLLESHPLQIDGEIVKCRMGDKIKVSVAKDAVTSLI